MNDVPGKTPQQIAREEIAALRAQGRISPEGAILPPHVREVAQAVVYAFKLEVKGEGYYKGPREVLQEELDALLLEPETSERAGRVAELQQRLTQAPD